MSLLLFQENPSLGANSDLQCIVSVAKKPKTIDSSPWGSWCWGTRCWLRMCDAVQSEFATRKAIAADEIAKMPAAGFCRRMHTLPPSSLRLCVHFTFMWESWVCSKQMISHMQQSGRPAVARRKLRLSVTHSRTISLVQRWLLLDWRQIGLFWQPRTLVGYDFCEWTRDVDDTQHPAKGFVVSFFTLICH